MINGWFFRLIAALMLLTSLFMPWINIKITNEASQSLDINPYMVIDITLFGGEITPGRHGALSLYELSPIMLISSIMLLIAFIIGLTSIRFERLTNLSILFALTSVLMFIAMFMIQITTLEIFTQTTVSYGILVPLISSIISYTSLKPKPTEKPPTEEKLSQAS